MPSLSTAACIAFALLANLDSSNAKQFSTNAICRQYNCINPIFPGLADLGLLEAQQLQCQEMHDVKQHMQFCKNAVYYDVALVSPKKSGNATTLQSVVMKQDNAAATMYYYHLAGMNVEGWENRHPEENGNPCTQAIWKMVCHTYFPRAEAGCKKGEATKHLRPCKNVCGSYVQACSVECCDESVQCVFSKKVALLDGTEMTTSGYKDELGPSATCTGAASQKCPSVLALIVASLALLQCSFPGQERGSVATADFRSWRPRLPLLSLRGVTKCAVCIVLFALCTTLQGCMMGQIFSHPTPTWEQMPNYWTQFQYIPEGEPASKKVYNSCDLNLPKRDQCSGNGECATWRPDLKASASGKSTQFCKCFRDWADPECRTKRKSQMTAFFLSVFLGFFGVDHFYLMDYYSGFLKLATFGGCGVWWVYDIVRIGSSPVYANAYRLAYDLPHYFYVMFTVGFFSFLGYFIFAVLGRAYRFEKAKNKFLMKEAEQHRKMIDAAGAFNPEDAVGMPGFASYPVPLPTEEYHSYGALPAGVKQSGTLNPFSPYGVFQHATKGYSPPGMYDGRLRPKYPEDFARKASAVPPMGYGY